MTPQQQHLAMQKHQLAELRSMAQHFEPDAKDRRLPRSGRPEDLADFDAEHQSLIKDIEYLERHVLECEALERGSTE